MAEPTRMETVSIPGTDLAPSRIGLGTWAIGGWMWGGADDDRAVRTIHEAIDRGITLVDTAPAYGQGHAEAVVGRALADGSRRDRVVLATKCALKWDHVGADASVSRDASARRIRQEVEDSLSRLKTDAIDIYQVHWPDPATPMEETARTMAALLQEGKIRAVGVSNFTPEQAAQFREHAPLHVVQPPYNLFEREIERDILPYARDHGIATLTYGAICRGLLSGRMTEDTSFPDGDLRQVDPKFRQPRFGEYVRAVHRLDDLARERFGRRVIHLALRWLLDQKGVSVALWGARRPDQLGPVGEVMGWSLDDAAKGEIDTILRDTVSEPVGPDFMAPPEPERRAA